MNTEQIVELVGNITRVHFGVLEPFYLNHLSFLELCHNLFNHGFCTTLLANPDGRLEVLHGPVSFFRHGWVSPLDNVLFCCRVYRSRRHFPGAPAPACSVRARDTRSSDGRTGGGTPGRSGSAGAWRSSGQAQRNGCSVQDAGQMPVLPPGRARRHARGRSVLLRVFSIAVSYLVNVVEEIVQMYQRPG